ncbi:MAG: FAD-dependent oxidoreductase [Ktedonobacteraceae bacterium]
MRLNTCTNAARPKTIQHLQDLIASAISQGQTVVPRGGGHNYDAALNSNGMALDLSLFRRILDWDPRRGIIKVEPGVMVDELWRTTIGSGWWPGVLPSRMESTIGGCLALNIYGANAWHAGSIGEHVRAFDLLLPSGELVPVTLHDNDELFYSAIGGLGMLGVITSITLQLHRIRSGKLLSRRRIAGSLAEMFEIFTDEAAREGYLMGWIDGYLREGPIGSGIVICGQFIEEDDPAYLHPRKQGVPTSIAKIASSSILRHVLQPLFDLNIKISNEMLFRPSMFDREGDAKHVPIAQFHFPFSPVDYCLRTMLSWGSYFFHPFVPARQAPDVFSRLLQLSQQSGFVPLWCILRQHRSDPFLLSYQVDGFSLELAYRVSSDHEARLVQLLRAMLNQVIEANGKLFLAQDRVLDAHTFRQMMGGEIIDRFLQIKATYDPNSLFQSNLFRRLFQIK